MKPESVVKVYTTTFSHCLLLLKVKEDFRSIEKMYCNEAQKSLSQPLLFEVPLFRLYFVSELL